MKDLFEYFGNIFNPKKVNQSNFLTYNFLEAKTSFDKIEIFLN